MTGRIINGRFGPNGEQLKRCPRCCEELDLSEFGIVRSQLDGLNLYCKTCIREKIRAFRERIRQMKKAREAALIAAGRKALGRSQMNASVTRKENAMARRNARWVRKAKTGAERILRAIEFGANTQQKIIGLTRDPIDDTCDALAQLLLWDRKIRTTIVGGERMYFLNEQQKRAA